ncbi:MAG: 5'-nucleotidase, lipoprotein e(P4) family [Proteobacteria bacterium]|nr:5'-nucleotidase, lipoprotein e(P4) family [Pseudomonadota bacterium]
MRLQPALTLLACSLAMTACKTMAPSAIATPAATTQQVPANDNLNAVNWMQRSTEYRASTETIYRAATARLDVLLANKDEDALVPEERGNSARGLPPAVVLDIDETVLDNSPYQARLIDGDKEYADATWDQWVEEKKARAVPGALAFTQAAARKGITVFYVSNRAVHLKDATIANLAALGFPLKDDSVFLGLGTFVQDCEQNGSEKLCRRKLVGQKYRVLMQFGDQLGDFVQVLSNTPVDRQALADKYAGWWGERWFMLPNPSYGNWEPALFNNNWRQSRDARRKAKRDALDLAH